MSRERKLLGSRGETAALNYLHRLGYLLVEKNYRRRGGEVDLILRDGPNLVFCEVKTSRCGVAAESYGFRQRRRMRAMVLGYLARSGWSGPVRVDLLALDQEPNSPHYRPHHFQNVLEGDDS